MRDQRPGILSTVAVYAAMVFLVLPLVAVIPVSFTSKRFLSMPGGQWSLQHYGEMVSNSEWLQSIQTSLLIAFLTALVSTVLATLFCVGVWYVRSRLTGVLLGLVLMPMAVPPIISALTLYFFVTSADVYDTLIGAVIAHVAMSVPYAVVTIMVSLSQIDRRIEMAARNLGASVWQTTFWVILPNIRFGVISAAFLSFILSWEEISVTLFVTSVDIITLPRKVWSGLRDNIDPVIASISVVLIAVTTVAIVLKLVAEARQSLREA
ncbi:ABC transporter permease [Mesorhizobium sp. CU2]|uniref:ABC transporter permease n=1 Tax=unclassified Mesorhizobium TaxID=325217 RepID=UPI00112C6CE9|nr:MULTISPECIES: ABC transporter permease [unclassified Mesorhizobium]TPN82582.1 ABC transporter permease [Mesorhizobium sp. CU3]TPO12786.1 ABC transporter permease [Mesorhizobium sp. CU2]